MTESDPLALLINESISYMYAGVYKLQQAGKLSSSGAKRMIADSLPRINKLELIFTKDGKVHEIDYDNPKDVSRIEKNIKLMKERLS